MSAPGAKRKFSTQADLSERCLAVKRLHRDRPPQRCPSRREATICWSLHHSPPQAPVSSRTPHSGRTVVRALPARADKSFSVQRDHGARAQLSLELVEGCGFGPARRFADNAHVFDMEVDPVAKRVEALSEPGRASHHDRFGARRRAPISWRRRNGETSLRPTGPSAPGPARSLELSFEIAAVSCVLRSPSRRIAAENVAFRRAPGCTRP